ncbi:outer membrane beta-barrel domain-containing protein [Bdellovibrio sp. HCB2-146]|uniref:outer membrane beta-barrel domain-containing protein n=1 Tax=Bdellovibrio sp. HCB2-146 TaxID=3394362 RepID=UPI0039BD1345
MMKNGFTALMILLAAFLLHRTAFAQETVELPVEELAKESVLPLFDKSESVKSRTVVTAKKIDINLLYGLALTEPVANVSKFGVSGYYNWDENNALGVLFFVNSTGLSSYANQLESKFPGQVKSFANAPMPKSTILVDYNAKAFYGKMSLSKSLVVNTTLLGSIGVGAVQYDNKTYPALAVGLGQKFYFNPHWALRFDLRLYANEAPIPFVAPSATTYDDRMTYTTTLDVGLTYLF